MSRFPRCTAITQGGGRCKGTAIDSSGLCHAHHPDRAEQRSRAAKKGGKRGGRGRRSQSGNAEIQNLKHQLCEMAEAVLSRAVPTAPYAVANQILNTLLRAIELERRIKETEDHEARLEKLEHAAERNQRQRGERRSTGA